MDDVGGRGKVKCPARDVAISQRIGAVLSMGAIPRTDKKLWGDATGILLCHFLETVKCTVKIRNVSVCQ